MPALFVIEDYGLMRKESEKYGIKKSKTVTVYSIFVQRLYIR